MRKFILDRFGFFVPFSIWFLVGLFSTSLMVKGSFVKYLDKLHNPNLDQFFRFATYLGDGWSFTILSIILIFFRIREALVAVLVFLISGGITQLLKNFVFFKADRPVKFFEGQYQFNPVEGVEWAMHHSFPSGHSTSAFALFCYLSLLIPNKYGILCFFLALTAAISRCYLAQHFFGDIFVGSLIGVFTAVILHNSLNNEESFIGKKTFAQKSILKLKA